MRARQLPHFSIDVVVDTECANSYRRKHHIHNHSLHIDDNSVVAYIMVSEQDVDHLQSPPAHKSGD